LSLALVFATFFSCTAGFAADAFGRRPTIMVSLLLFTMGATVCACAISLIPLLIGRALIGTAFGSLYLLDAEHMFITGISSMTVQ
jgi:MFS family permease